MARPDCRPSIVSHHHEGIGPPKLSGLCFMKGVLVPAPLLATRIHSLVSPFPSFLSFSFIASLSAGPTWRPLTQTIIRVPHDYRATGPTNSRRLNP